MITRNQEGTPNIVAIEDKKGVVMYDTESIQRIFVDFYSRLYRSEISNIREKQQIF